MTLSFEIVNYPRTVVAYQKPHCCFTSVRYFLLLYLNAKYRTQLVQIASRDIHKYALFTNRSANQSIVNSILPRK